MSRISKDWSTEMQEKLNAISVNYSIQEKEKIKFHYLNNLLVKLPELEIDDNDMLINELKAIIEILPLSFDELIYESYMSKFNDLEYLVRKRYNLIPYRHHRIATNSFSFANVVGYIFSGLLVYFFILIFKKPLFVLAIGAPFGIVVSKLIGIYFDKKAEKENRVI